MQETSGLAGALGGNLGAPDPESTARTLLVFAASAPDPSVLVEAARVLLNMAGKKRENVVRFRDAGGNA